MGNDVLGVLKLSLDKPNLFTAQKGCRSLLNSPFGTSSQLALPSTLSTAVRPLLSNPYPCCERRQNRRYRKTQIPSLVRILDLLTSLCPDTNA